MVKYTTIGRKVNKSKRGASMMTKRSKSIKPKTICKIKRGNPSKRGPKKMNKTGIKNTKSNKVKRRNKSRSACRQKRTSVMSNKVKRRSKSRSACRQKRTSVKSNVVKRRSKSRSACRQKRTSVMSNKVKRRSKSRSACRQKRTSGKSNVVKRRSKSRSACRQKRTSVKSIKVNQRSNISTRKSLRSRSTKNRKLNKCKRNVIKKGPKRPRSAYIFFYKYEFCRANEINKITIISEFAKKAGKMWRQMNKADKVRYNKMAETDQKRYMRLTRGKRC